MKALGRQMRPGAVPVFILSAFVGGMGVVWLYAVAPTWPGHLTLAICLILLVGVVLASVCGAWVYKEQANP